MAEDVENCYHTKMSASLSLSYSLCNFTQVGIEHYHEFNPYSLVIFPVTFDSDF